MWCIYNREKTGNPQVTQAKDSIQNSTLKPTERFHSNRDASLPHDNPTKTAAVVKMARDVQLSNNDAAPDSSPVAVKTKFMPMGPPCSPPVELKQFSGVTSSTSAGSANVISTHYRIHKSATHEHHLCKRRKLTEYNAAPCTAVSINWIVALSPTL